MNSARRPHSQILLYSSADTAAEPKPTSSRWLLNSPKAQTLHLHLHQKWQRTAANPPNEETGSSECLTVGLTMTRFVIKVFCWQRWKTSVLLCDVIRSSYQTHEKVSAAAAHAFCMFLILFMVERLMCSWSNSVPTCLRHSSVHLWSDSLPLLF